MPQMWHKGAENDAQIQSCDRNVGWSGLKWPKYGTDWEKWVGTVIIWHKGGSKWPLNAPNMAQSGWKWWRNAIIRHKRGSKRPFWSRFGSIWVNFRATGDILRPLGAVLGSFVPNSSHMEQFWGHFKIFWGYLRSIGGRFGDCWVCLGPF